MPIPYRDQAKKTAPYVMAYALGAASFWIVSAIFSGPSGTITAATYVSEVVSSPSANVKRAPETPTAPTVFALPTSVVYTQKPSPESLRDAARDGDLHSVRRLLAQSVDVDAVDEDGRSALMMAAGSGEAGVVATLIDAGAKIDLKSKDGETALMSAVVRGDSETVRMLIEHEADVLGKNKEGASVHDLAIRNKQDHIARLVADEIDRINRERVMVTRAQFLLAKIGYRPGAIDGNLGPRTRDSIMRFQRDQEIGVDGRVSETLLAALDERQKAVEESRRAQRLARAQASKNALRKASETRPKPARKKPSDWKKSGDSDDGNGFFDRAGRWFERNLGSE